MKPLIIVGLAAILVPRLATADLFRSEPGLGIPDNVAVGIADTLEASPSLTITDLNIALEIEHTWIGDLIFTVTHGGVTVTIVDRPGVPSNTVGCHADLACTREIVLDDEAEGAPPDSIECGDISMCSTCFPGDLVPARSYFPNAALGAFDNIDQAGPWILTASDNWPADTGRICAWEVRTNNTLAVEPATWGGIKARYRD